MTLDSNTESMTQQKSSDNELMQFLKNAGIQFEAKGHSWYKLKSGPYQDLTVEHWKSSEQLMTISVCHYGEQNGDLMKDPEIVIKWDLDLDKIRVEEFYQDYVGAYRTCVNQDGTINKAEARDLLSFANDWGKNLKIQGHVIAERDVEL